MSYLVLARKWRPQTFSDLVGQEHVSPTLANAIQRNGVAHAFLFTGVRGVGKTTSARILAKALNCDERARRPTPCLRCAPRAQRSPTARDMDVQEIDGASYNGVDEVRRLQESLALPPRARSLQDLHRGRGPHALERGVERVLEDAGGAAAAREVHLRDDRGPQGPGHDPVAAASATTSSSSPRRSIAERLAYVLEQEKIARRRRRRRAHRARGRRQSCATR